MRLSSSSRVPATAGIYALSLHDALPIFCGEPRYQGKVLPVDVHLALDRLHAPLPREVDAEAPQGFPRCIYLSRKGDRKSTRLNSSHTVISYAVFCWKQTTDEEPGFGRRA